MDTILILGGGLVLLALLSVGYIKLSDPANVDEEEEEIVEEETAEELAEEERREYHKTKKEQQEEEIDFYKHE